MLENDHLTKNITFDDFKSEILNDYKVAVTVENVVYWEDERC